MPRIPPVPGAGAAPEALRVLSRRLQAQEEEMELVKAALAEALRLLRMRPPHGDGDGDRYGDRRGRVRK